MTVYHEYSAKWQESTRETIIRNGWGTTTPVHQTRNAKGRLVTKVQVVELTEAEFATWTDARQHAQENSFVGFGR
jgi:hypothetical protein